MSRICKIQVDALAGHDYRLQLWTAVDEWTKRQEEPTFRNRDEAWQDIEQRAQTARTLIVELPREWTVDRCFQVIAEELKDSSIAVETVMIFDHESELITKRDHDQLWLAPT